MIDKNDVVEQMYDRIVTRLEKLNQMRDELLAMVEGDPRLNEVILEAINALSKPIDYLEVRKSEGEYALAVKKMARENPDFKLKD